MQQELGIGTQAIDLACFVTFEPARADVTPTADLSGRLRRRDGQ